MRETSAINPARQEQFVEKVVEQISGTMTTLLGAVGDRLGLFKNLAEQGPATSAELASRTKLNERYLREWLGGMATAGYLDYDGSTKRFSLPAEHASVLAQENGPFFIGGIYQMLPAQAGVFDQVVSAFRNGGGVSQSQYTDMMWDGLERLTSTWFENLLLQQWIPAMPDVKAHLERGCDVADVGCGRGRGLIKLAQAFPRSRYIGYDNFGPTVARATANAREAGVSDRVRFEERDVSKELPAHFDVIHRALRPGGVYVCLDINCSDKLEENANPLGAMFHGVSVFYCMTTSLANNGAGLGTLGFHEAKVRELCDKAGFSSVRRVPLENPFNNLYEARP